LKKQAAASATKSQAKLEEVNDEVFDLFTEKDFTRALYHKIGRPFAFGPIEFHGLDSDRTFDAA
jgi:uncharacterized protein YllA (UPF0747 family)